MEAAPLAEPDRVQVFSDQVTALAYQRATEVAISSYSNVQLISVTVGTSLVWDSEPTQREIDQENSTSLFGNS